MSSNAKAPEGGYSSEASAPAGLSPDGVAARKIADAIDPSMADPGVIPYSLIGAHRSEDHEYWWNGQGPVPSVTTLLGIIDKSAVAVFKAKEAARAVYRAFPQGHLSGDEDEVIKWALKEADKARDTAAELGSSVHLLADLVGADESQSTGWEASEREKPYIEAYRAFLGRYGASSIVSSEHMVWSLNGYAGTYDLILRGLDCEKHSECLWLVDIKTSGKGPYPEWGLQLAGYRWADYIIIPGDPRGYPMPEIQHTAVLHLRPDLYTDTGWRLIEYPLVYEKDYLAFLAALELWKWRKEGRFLKSKLMKP